MIGDSNERSDPPPATTGEIDADSDPPSTGTVTASTQSVAGTPSSEEGTARSDASAAVAEVPAATPDPPNASAVDLALASYPFITTS
jgi:hypothetical protein